MIDFILSRCVPVGECVVWQGARNNGGYGTVRYQGRLWVVSRLMLALASGGDRPGMDACHSIGCSSRACVRREHLRWDTRRGNSIDTRTEHNHPHQRLTYEAASDIRRLAAKGLTPRQIGERFGVAGHYVSRILRGDIWRPRQEGWQSGNAPDC